MAGRRWTGFPPLQDLPDALGFTGGPVRLDYQPSLGFALYAAGALTSRPLDIRDGSVDLVVFPENPGAEGVELGVQWEGCADGEMLRVSEAATFPLSVPPCAGERVTVAFLNDADVAGKDRNVFLRVRDR